MSEMSELQAIIAFVCTTEVLYLSDVSFSEVATILRVSSSQFESVALVFWTIVSVSFTNNSYLGPNLLNGGSRWLSRNSHPTCRRSMQEHSIPRLPQDRPNHPLSTAQPLSQGFQKWRNDSLHMDSCHKNLLPSGLGPSCCCVLNKIVIAVIASQDDKYQASKENLLYFKNQKG